MFFEVCMFSMIPDVCAMSYASRFSHSVSQRRKIYDQRLHIYTYGFMLVRISKALGCEMDINATESQNCIISAWWFLSVQVQTSKFRESSSSFHKFPSIQIQLSTSFQASEFQVSTKFQASNFKFSQVSKHQIQVSRITFQIPSSKFQISSINFQVPGFKLRASTIKF